MERSRSWTLLLMAVALVAHANLTAPATGPYLVTVPVQKADSLRLFFNGPTLAGTVHYKAGQAAASAGGSVFLGRGDSLMVRLGEAGQVAGLVQFVGGTVIMSAVELLEDLQRPAYTQLIAWSHADRRMLFEFMEVGALVETRPEGVVLVLGGLETRPLTEPAYRNISGKNARRRANIEFLLTFFDADP